MNAQLKLPFNEPAVRYNQRVIERLNEVLELQSEPHVNDVIKLAKEFIDDVDLKEHINPLVVKYHCAQCVADTRRKWLNCWVAYYKGEAVGFLVGVCFRTWYNNKIVAEQKLWFVSKQYRGTSAAFSLIKAYENWARLNGATQIYTGTANERYAEATKVVLERLGYRHVGSLHVKEV